LDGYHEIQIGCLFIDCQTAIVLPETERWT